MSPELWDGVKAKVNSTLGMEIQFKVVDEVTDGRGSFDGVIGARTGTFFDRYDPLLIPDRRPNSPQEVREMIFLFKTPSLAYFPVDFKR